MVSTPTPLRILALTHCPPAEPCTFARIFTPLQALQAQGLVEYTLEPIWPWRAATFQHLMSTLTQWDIIWVARPRHYLILPLIREARRVGTPILVDIDDWLLESPDSVNAAEWCGTRASRSTMRGALQAADAVTTSTPTIAERCAALGVRSHVIPNAVDAERFVRLDRPIDRPVTIGFCGTAAHLDDVPLVAPALQHLLAGREEHVQIVTAGCPIPTLLGANGYTHHASVAATEYPALLSSLRLDIGLAPLYDTSFNRARSDIKYLEYSATGAATVASPVAEYRTSLQPDRGILVESPTEEAWLASIVDLIDDPSKRIRLAENAYRWVHAERSIAATATRWLSLFNKYVNHLSVKESPDPHPTIRGIIATGEHVVLGQTLYYGMALPGLARKKVQARRRAGSRSS